MGVDRLDREANSGGVLVEEVGRHGRGLVGVTRHRRVLDADAAPAALGLDPPECRLRSRHRHAEARRVRHLVEAVREYLRPDGYRLKEDGMTGVHVRAHAGPGILRTPASRRGHRSASAALAACQPEIPHTTPPACMPELA